MSVAKANSSPLTLGGPTNPVHRPWPAPARSWFMRMVWHDLLFMHWRMPVEEMRASLPPGIELDTFEGEAWIGIVPFRMSGVAPRFVPNLPWLSSFPELNVRTYVKVDGKPGVWFYSLDATNPIAVRGARRLFHLNYLDANIKSSKSKGWIRYTSRRTHTNEPAAVLDLEYRAIGDSFLAQPGTLLDWLTSRYCLYVTAPKSSILRGEIDHPPWSLSDGQAIVHSNTMLNGLGLELPADEPLIHFAHKTSVVAWKNQPV